MLRWAVRQKPSREKCPLQRRYCSCLITTRTLTTPKTHSRTIIGRLLAYLSQMHWIRVSPTPRSKSLRDKISRIQYSSSNLSKTLDKLSRKWSSRRHWRVTKWKRRRKRTKTNGWSLTIQSSMMKSKLMKVRQIIWAVSKFATLTSPKRVLQERKATIRVAVISVASERGIGARERNDL